MTSAENIKKLIRKAAIDTNQEVNESVLNGLLEEFDKAEKQSSAASQPGIWRTVIKSKITKLAAAAVIITAACVVIVIVSRLRDNSEQKRRQHTLPSSVVARPDDNLVSDNGRDSMRMTIHSVDGDAYFIIDGNLVDGEELLTKDAIMRIEQMAVEDDVNALISVLKTPFKRPVPWMDPVEFASKVAAAELLGEIGDERALPELKQLNRELGSSGAFAVAICKILTRHLSEDEQIDALFELLEGKGPAVPARIDESCKIARHHDIGRRVAEELDRFEDPSIVARLRKTDNYAAAIHAVWMEVRDMEMESAIARCMEIARAEDGAGQYGAIRCLEEFGEDAIDALDELAAEGYDEAIRVLNLIRHGINLEIRENIENVAVSHPIWREVQNMEKEEAIARCVEIARTEEGKRRRVAIVSLGKFGDDAIDALDELARQGLAPADHVVSLLKRRRDSGIAELICWHLTNNKNSNVRLRAVGEVVYGGILNARPHTVEYLIEAMYDPNETIRNHAAQGLAFAASWPQHRNSPYAEEIEYAMLIALKHPDKRVREHALKALEKLGSDRMGEKVPDPPSFRTDLEANSKPPSTTH
jgi:HEAT repeat protein